MTLAPWGHDDPVRLTDRGRDLYDLAVLAFCVVAAVVLWWVVSP